MFLTQLRSNNFGICSICSAHAYVIRTACHKAIKTGKDVLIESTSNQVDQFGGYTGMTPSKFVSYVHAIAKKEGLKINQIILGGDHLGPNSWRNNPAEIAMKNAQVLIRDYIKAGYRKIHLDTSMPCADDPVKKDATLAVEIIAERAAKLCEVAESNAPKGKMPLYVIGSDVPIPGGASEDLSDIKITAAVDVKETIDITKKAFSKLGLEEAWERVIAVVVQPGVEFGDSTIIEYQRKKASDLSRFIETYENLVYEAHSTDYQTEKALRQMVQDHFAILKVGPWLTFAYREVLFALHSLEHELLSSKKNIRLSGLLHIIEQQMLKYPKYWMEHYKGNASELAIKRKYSFSDRIRYYWADPEISESVKRLLSNLYKLEIPLSLISQLLPAQYEAVRRGEIKNNADAFLEYGIEKVLDQYHSATNAA